MKGIKILYKNIIFFIIKENKLNIKYGKYK